MKTQFQLIDEIKFNFDYYKLEADDIFNAYLIQRGLSMMNPLICDLLNETTNILYRSLDDQMAFDLWKLIVPKTRERTIWIKKAEKDVKEGEKKAKIKEVAKLLERSVKAIQLMTELDPDFLKQFEEKGGFVKKMT